MDRATTHRVGERFRLGRVLKASASGTVYVATERDSDREVVVKIIGLTAPLPPEAVRTRFQRAVSLLGEIAHPAYPGLLEVGWASTSEAYVITEIVQGTPLVEQGRFEIVRTLALLVQVGEALDRLHTAGSAHLNVAPDNVLVTPTNTVKLVGLGSGWLPGTVNRSEFVAPEVAVDLEAAVPWRADIFSFARTICGSLGLAAVPEGSQRFIVELSGDVAGKLADPRRFREVLERSLHRQPDERPSSLSEVLRALGASIGAELLEAESQPVDEDEGQDRTVKIDLETVTRLRTERAARHEEAALAPGASPVEEAGKSETTAGPRAESAGAGEEAPALPTAETSDEDEADDGGMERTMRIETARERMATAPPPEAEAHDAGAPATDPPPSKKRSPDTSPISVPPSIVQNRPAATESTDTNAAVDAGSENVEGTPPAPEAAGADTTAKDEEDSAPITAPIPTAAAAPRASSSISRPWPWVAFFVSVVGLALIVWAATSPRRAPELDTAETTIGATTAPADVVPTVPAARLLIDQAEAALTDGDASAAELALAGLTVDQIAALPRQERERIMAIRTAIAERRRWDLVRALDAALASGDIPGIRRAVNDLAGDEQGPAQSQELQRKLAQARRLVQLDNSLSDALRRRNWGKVLETSGAILGILSNNTEAAAARADAAAALEAEADDLSGRGSYDAALARLAVLRRWWPERDGLAARTARLESRRQAVRSIREKLANAEAAGRDGHPDDGLGLLAGLPTRGAYSTEIRALKSRLQEQLASLDEGIPRVSPAPESSLEYEKNQPAVIAVKVEDDYRVATVALFARREGGTGYAQFIAVREQPDTWVVRIPVAFHQNETVEFYATATDPSGHRGELGNEAAPLELKRRRRGLFGR